MSPDPLQLAATLRAGRIAHVDLAHARTDNTEAEHFLLMWSIGPDASVIERLSSSRSRPNGHAAYFGPILAEGLSPLLAHVTIEVDGSTLVENTQGWVVVSNSAHYACRCNFAPRASMSDGLLDVTFVPARSTVHCCLTLLQARRGTLSRARNTLTAQGQHVRVSAARPRGLCAQIDGERSLATATRPDKLDITLSIERGVLPVLLPAGD
jgi:diacylglycerol kinase family enzyme